MRQLTSMIESQEFLVRSRIYVVVFIGGEVKVGTQSHSLYDQYTIMEAFTDLIMTSEEPRTMSMSLVLPISPSILTWVTVMECLMYGSMY